jgi:molecular chaperone HtpG
MTLPATDTALLVYLRSHSTMYHGKLLELRETVGRWLSYVPQTFPHYTRHTIEHSDEIVRQMSQLLFHDNDTNRPVATLSTVEIYVLIATAYLHDAGMVASDTEKLAILSSQEWREWTSGSGGGAKRWQEIEALRSGQNPMDDTLRNFAADVQQRYLIAEFIRRIHHVRAATLIQQHQTALAMVAFDDPALQRTISDVCLAHGLPHHELEDQERFPDRRDIRGETINVKFAAIVLRLGDLLDMSVDRACPLLLNAASPLPSNSLAHWTQYQRIIGWSPESVTVAGGQRSSGRCSP